MPGLVAEALCANAAFAAVALALGEEILRRVEAAVGASSGKPSLRRLGAALLAGFGASACAGIVLAAVGLFRWEAFAVCGLAVVALGRRRLAAYGRAGARFLGRTPRAGPVVLGASLVAAVVGVSQWLAALAPPEATDELAYHLPEARTLADGHTLHLMLGTDRIYGNLPTLAETLYGEALAIQGTALVHALHLSILVAFMLLAAGVVRTLWGARAAALATAGIALYSDLLYNATTGYVDAAATSFEAGGVLLLALWLVRGDDAAAGAGALLLGFAAGVKYTALASVLLAAILAAAVVRRRRSRRLALALPALALAGCAYWYGKNLVRFGNPVFPFAFGHPGVSDATYRYFVGSVEAFGPRTLTRFLWVPTRFASDASATAFLGFALAPLAPVARGPWRAAALLLAYVAAYTTYWFWLGSHQLRFLSSAVVVAIVLAAVAVGAARGAAGLAAATVLAAALAGVAQLHTQGFNLHVRGAVAAWLDSSKARYALGLETRSAYLHRYFGCQVDAVETLAARRLAGAVALWDLDPPPDYPRRNRLEPMNVTATTPAGVRAELRARGVRFALAQGRPVTELSSNPAARSVLAAARPFWRLGDCTLYRLPPSA